MRYLPLVLVLAACESSVPPATIAQVPFAADSGDIAIRCGTLIDGLSDEASTDRLVVIRNGRFERIAPGDASAEIDIPYLNLSEYTCLPGLINTHVHLAELPEDSVDYGVYYRRSDDEHIQLTLDMARLSLLTGFTTVRNVGDFYPNAIYAGREQIRSGQAIGPRIQSAGPYLTIPGGGGDLVVPYLDESEIPPAGRTGVAKGAHEFREKAELAVAEGADLLKVIASGAVFSFGVPPGAPEMTREEIEAVVEVARNAGIKVSAHVHSAQSGKDAVLAGVDTLEHASLLDDEAIALVAEHGVSLSMDVYNGTYTDTVGREQGYPEEYLRRNFDTTETQRVVFEKAYALGVPITYGTDGGVLPHDMGGWQFGIMVERGMAPMDAIKSATSVASHYMDLPDVGAIEAGRFGDLIAVRSNPLDDMEIMKTVDVVIKGGLLFKNDTDDGQQTRQ
jgi:imidazolonepropionase-like amidohydrolase